MWLQTCGGQMGSEKRTVWWNQEVKEAIRAKKTAFRACLTNKSSEQLQLRYFAARKTAANIVKVIERISTIIEYRIEIRKQSILANDR